MILQPRFYDLRMYERRHPVNEVVQPLSHRVPGWPKELNYVFPAPEKFDLDFRVILARKQSCQNILVSIHMLRSLGPLSALSRAVFCTLEKRHPPVEKICVNSGCAHNSCIGRERKTAAHFEAP